MNLKKEFCVLKNHIAWSISTVDKEVWEQPSQTRESIVTEGFYDRQDELGVWT